MINIPRSVWRYGLLICFCITIAYGWLMTLTGLRLTLQCLTYMAHEVHLTGLQGYLAGPIKVQSLYYRSATFQCAVTDLSIQWEKRALLKGKLKISQLHLGMIKVVSEGEGSLFDIKKLSRLQVDHIKLGEGELKTNNYLLKVKGTLSENKPLLWNFTGYHFNSRGHIKRTPNGHIQCFAKSVASKLFAQSITHFQWVATYKYPHCEIRMTSQKTNKYTNFIHLRISEIGALNTLHQPFFVDINAKLHDFQILSALGIIQAKSIPLKAPGPVLLKGHLESTKSKLLGYLYPPKGQMWIHSQYPLPVQGELSIDWESPTLLGLEDGSHLAIQGKLNAHDIKWDAQLTQNTVHAAHASSLKWRLIGNMYNVLKKSTVDKTLPLWKQLNLITYCHVEGDPLWLFKDAPYAVKVAPQIEVKGCNRQLSLNGKVDIPEGKFNPQFRQETIVSTSDIYFIENGKKVEKETWPFDCNLHLHFGQSVYFHYPWLKARIVGSLVLKKLIKEDALFAQGEIAMLDGEYYYFGQHLHIDPHSKLIFIGQLDNPFLDIKASREIRIKPSHQGLMWTPTDEANGNQKRPPYLITDVKLPHPARVGVHLRGPLTLPTMSLFSCPPGWLDPLDTLSYIITGQPVTHIQGKALLLLLYVAAQLTKGYQSYHGAFSDRYEKFGMNVDLDSDELSKSIRLIFSKPLTSALSVAYKPGLFPLSHVIGLHYLFNQNMLMNVSIDPSHLISGISAIEMVYQKEWG